MSPHVNARSCHSRRSFIGGSDARIIMGDDEAALLRLWREKRARLSLRTCPVVAIPRDKIANAVLKGGLRPEADVAHQIPDIGEGFGDIARLHRQHILYRRPAQLLLQK